jgi:hypothetical protein
MRLLQVRARNGEDADCLMRELTAYAPMRSGRSVLIEIEERSETALLALLAAAETCLTANEISGVRLEVDGHRYLMAPR